MDKTGSIKIKRPPGLNGSGEMTLDYWVYPEGSHEDFSNENLLEPTDHHIGG